MKIAIVASSPITINVFLRSLILRLAKSHQVTVISNVKSEDELLISGENISITSIKINRKISYWADLSALKMLLKCFRGNKFDLVFSVTPKSGFLAMSASFITGIKKRVHIYTGQVWVTSCGLRKFILKKIDKLIGKLATHLLADSSSQMKFLINEKIVCENKIEVLANGSISGVNLTKFTFDHAIRSNTRLDLNFDEKDFVFLFLGRLDPDKGILILIDAFKLLSEQFDNVKLVIVGPDEAGMREHIISTYRVNSDLVRFIGLTTRPENYMNAADALCLPSYREGFGSVVIEAAAVGIPAIGSDIYGIRDAIVDNVTGFLFPVGDVKVLFEAMQAIMLNEKIRKKMGRSAKQRVREKFSQELVVTAYTEFFDKIYNCD